MRTLPAPGVELTADVGPVPLDLLCHEILPRVFGERDARDGDRDIRIWSAGCATGDGPYSIAMALATLGVCEGIHILRTEANRRELQRAVAGRYAPRSNRHLPERMAGRYFERRRAEPELDSRIREMVEFRHLNLVTDDYPSAEREIADFDVILCRNVLVGLTPGCVRAVGRRLVASLRPGGWLVPGAADPRLDDVPDAYVEATHSSLVYRRVAPRFLHARVEALQRTGGPARA